MEDQLEKYHEYQILYNAGVDMKERTIYLVGDIDLGTVDTMVQAIGYFNSEKNCPDAYQRPIQIYINSLGGSDDLMMFGYDAIIRSACEVQTIGSGMVCSAATLLLVAGDKRACTENCLFMVHKGSTTITGNEDEIQAGAEIHKKVSTQYWRLLERHTTLTAAKWLSLSKRKGEVWIDAATMRKYGVVDEVISSPRRTFEPLSTRKMKI